MNTKTQQFLGFLTIVLMLVAGVYATTSIGPTGITSDQWLNTTAGVNSTGPIYGTTGTFTTIDTGQGANELYGMDQNVKTTSSVTHDDVTVSDELTVGGISITSWGDLNTTLFADNVTTADFIYWVDAGTYYSYEADSATTTSNASLAVLLETNIAAASGGDHFLKTGTYTLIDDDGIDIAQTGTTLRGGGYDTLIQCEAGFSDWFIHVTAQGASIYNLRLDGTGQDANGGMYLESTRGVFHHMRIEDMFHDGIHAGHNVWSGVLGGKIHHMTIDDCGGSGIYMDYDATDWEIIDCLISNMDSAGEAAVMVDAGSTLIMGCHMWGNYYNIRVAPAHNVYRLRVVANKIADNDYHGFAVMDGYDLRASFITGNEFWANGYSGAYNHSDSIFFDGDAGQNVYGVSITGNAFFGYKEDVTTYCTRYAINDEADVLQYCVITGNTFMQYMTADPVVIDTTDNVDMANAYYLNDGASSIDVTG